MADGKDIDFASGEEKSSLHVVASIHVFGSLFSCCIVHDLSPVARAASLSVLEALLHAKCNYFITTIGQATTSKLLTCVGKNSVTMSITACTFMAPCPCLGLSEEIRKYFGNGSGLPRQI
jgi:hypothetical protein